MGKNLLNLSEAEIEKELDRLAKLNPPRSKPWTTKETEILRKAYVEKNLPAKTISKLLDRTLSSTVNHITELGLTKRR